MRTKLIRGPSKRSHLLLAWRHAHLFVWAPSHSRGATRVDESFGGTFRFRRDGGWTHVRLALMQRNRIAPQRWRATQGEVIRARRTLTLAEISWWRTEPDTSKRVGLKGYVRVKLSPGGRTLR